MSVRVMLKKARAKVKRTVNRFARNNRWFDSLYGRVIRRKREKRYLRYADLPVDDRQILFESFRGRRYTDGPKAIYRYMLAHEEFKDFHFVWCMRNSALDQCEELLNDPRTRIVTWGSDDYYKAYAQSKYWFPNTRIPDVIQRKDNQVYIQLMHGTPLKRTGTDIHAETEAERETTRRVIDADVSRYSYLLSPSHYFTEVITTAFDLEELGMTNVVREIGYPRNDSIVNHTKEDAEKVRSGLGIPADSRVMLYAPTYREDNRKNRYEHHEPLDFDRLLANIPQDIIILFRTHYFISQNFDFEKYGGRIMDVSAYPDINDLYIISDLLLTDYSSVLFDYGILERPMIYHMHDLEHYRDELRGLYFDPEELPGRVVRTQDELEEAINTLENWTHSSQQNRKWKEFRDRFTYLEDGRASERAASLVLE